MTTGEGLAWLLFIFIITLLFFAAFGTSSITEESIEEYMDNLVKKIKENRGS
jgi:hypothetical protein